MNVSAVGHPYTYTHTLSFSGCISCGETFCNTPRNDDVTSNNNNNNTTTKKRKKRKKVHTSKHIWPSGTRCIIFLFHIFFYFFLVSLFGSFSRRSIWWMRDGGKKDTICIDRMPYWTSTCTLNIDDIIVKLCIFWTVYISLRYTTCNVLHWTKGCMISSEIECAPPNSKYNLITLFESLWIQRKWSNGITLNTCIWLWWTNCDENGML